MAGISAFLKAVSPGVQCLLADPHSSRGFAFVKSGGSSSEASEGSSIMEGIGMSRITDNFSVAEVSSLYGCGGVSVHVQCCAVHVQCCDEVLSCTHVPPYMH